GDAAAHRSLGEEREARGVDVPGGGTEELDHPLGGIEPGRVARAGVDVDPSADAAGVVAAVVQLDVHLEPVIGPGGAAGVELRVAAAVVDRGARGRVPVGTQPQG